MRSHIFFKTFLKQIGLSLLVLFLAFGGAYYYLLSYTKSGFSVEVPNLAGLDIIEVKAALKGVSLEPEIVDSIFVFKKRGGEVISHEPIGGSRVKEGRKIFLTVTRYKPPMVKLPNVIDQGVGAAIARLQSYGFIIDEIIPEQSECSECIIAVEFKGQRKEAGSVLPRGGKINLVVGTGESGEVIPAPELIGFSFEEVKMLLQSNSLRIGAYPFDKPEDVDSSQCKSWKQSIDAGEMIPVGSSIDVYFTSDLNRIPEKPSNDSIQ